MVSEEVNSNLKYLTLLAKLYPTVQSASTEIINLQAILGLPKGTEHFISDVHGEHEAFEHIMNNASGMIREKVDILFGKSVSSGERALLSTLIYYPEQKLDEVKDGAADINEWYRITLYRLIEVCRLVASKYTRSKVRKALPAEFEYIIDELLHTNYDIKNKEKYYQKIISTIVDIDRADAFICALCNLIKRLIVDRLHLVGDIFDRGARPDKILDRLMEHHSVDIQWGNHDILWMGAAAGSGVCIATVLNHSMQYNNLDLIETAYGINLRPLALFAQDIYRDCDCSLFEPKSIETGKYDPADIQLVARMHKAITIIQFKLEEQILQRHPEFEMNERMLLSNLDFPAGTIRIGEKCYPLRDHVFPTVNPKDPCKLTPEEDSLMEQLITSFRLSDKLQRHTRFLYSSGGLYKCCNGNLLFHSSIPMNPDGSFMRLSIAGKKLSGRQYMDMADAVARLGYNAKIGSREKQYGEDYMWFLWCGKNSPLFGRSRITTFERLLVAEHETWEEPSNPYYQLIEREEIVQKILQEFGLSGSYSHIVNGHIPIRLKDGERPVKAGGKLIFIDGGFCKAYQQKTGTAGYTLFYNSYGIRLVSHKPFENLDEAIKNNKDIFSTSVVYETAAERITVGETDVGRELKEKIEELKLLLAAYRIGAVKEHTKK